MEPGIRMGIFLHVGGSATTHMGVSKNRGTPKWMVKIMENPIKMDDLGVPLFSETSIYVCGTAFLLRGKGQH